MTRFLCAEKADKKFCKTRGEEQSKEVDSRQQHTSSFKTQAQGRKDTPGRSEVSSSFKTQQTGQGRRPKAEFKVHSDLARRPNKNQWFTETRP
jgi:hypothetical protein